MFHHSFQHTFVSITAINALKGLISLSNDPCNPVKHLKMPQNKHLLLEQLSAAAGKQPYYLGIQESPNFNVSFIYLFSWANFEVLSLSLLPPGPAPLAGWRGFDELLLFLFYIFTFYHRSFGKYNFYGNSHGVYKRYDFYLCCFYYDITRIASNILTEEIV